MITDYCRTRKHDSYRKGKTEASCPVGKGNRFLSGTEKSDSCRVGQGKNRFLSGKETERFLLENESQFFCRQRFFFPVLKLKKKKCWETEIDFCSCLTRIFFLSEKETDSGFVPESECRFLRKTASCRKRKSIPVVSNEINRSENGLL